MTALTRALEWFIEPDRREHVAEPPEPDPERSAPDSKLLADDSQAVGAGRPLALGSAPLVDDSRSGGARGPLALGSAPLVDDSPASAARAVTCAAVLGRPGEAEPVAAALALALRRAARVRAATVCVLGPVAGPAQAGGVRAARRLATRLDVQGLEAGAKGRLVWVRLPGPESAALAAARRAAVVGPLVVLAVTVPRSAALDELLAEQDLVVVVTADPAGPLARLAVSAVLVPPIAVRPLSRGLARSLSRAGLRPARAATELARAAAAPSAGGAVPVIGAGGAVP